MTGERVDRSKTGAGDTSSVLSGSARDVVQARDISGGVHFHAKHVTSRRIRLVLAAAVLAGAGIALALLLHQSGTQRTSLLDLPVYGQDSGFHTGPQKVAGQSYQQTLSQPSACPSYNSPQEITYELAGRYKQLTMQVGISDDVPPGRVGAPPGMGRQFTVEVDGRLVGPGSMVLSGQTPQTMTIDVSGASQVTLLATKAGWGVCTGDPLVMPVWINPVVSS